MRIFYNACLFLIPRNVGISVCVQFMFLDPTRYNTNLIKKIREHYIFINKLVRLTKKHRAKTQREFINKRKRAFPLRTNIKHLNYNRVCTSQ